jgi:hypothetical protein
MATSRFVGILSFACGLIMTANPAYAVQVDFNSWQKFGDVTTSAVGSARLSNDAIQNDDFPSPTGTYSYTTTPAVEANGTLQGNLGLSNNALDIGGTAYEGSGIKNTINATAGDRLTFNWKFLTNEVDSTFNDFAFLSVDNTIIQLANVSNATITSSTFDKETAVTSYTYTFPNTAAYNVAFGVVDVGDYTTSSGLEISNANIEPVPEPITIMGSLVALGFGGCLRRRFGKKS